MDQLQRCRKAALVALGLVAFAAPAAAQAKPTAQTPKRGWHDCRDGFQCEMATVPLDYSDPGKGLYKVAVIRKPATDTAHRIGSLFTNPGGPGASGVDFVRATARSLYAKLNERYDIVGFDPRGTGASQDAIDCKVDPEQDGIYAQPFTTPDTLDVLSQVADDAAYAGRCRDLNKDVLPYVTTGNVARDLDRLRAAVGDERLHYLGFSYGTFLGATYASLFPDRLGRIVLDGPVDATEYINHPMDDLSAQTAGFERAIGRFFQACAADQATCLGFGAGDPWSAFDVLAAQLDTHALPAAGYAPDPRPVDGDDLRAAAIQLVYAKRLWPDIAQMLAGAAAGDGTAIRSWADAFYGRKPGGSYGADTDRYYTISAVEQRYVWDPSAYLQASKTSYNTFDHFWFNNGYSEIAYPLLGVRPNGAFYGPFRIPAWASTPLVVATTYDPATPYPGAKGLVRDLGNARLLTMNGDGHTAYGGNSGCVDSAVEAYFDDGTLPAAGTVCQQEVPFAQPSPAAVQKARIQGGRCGGRLPFRPLQRSVSVPWTGAMSARSSSVGSACSSRSSSDR
jgi:pimeloyl-ACP methyl ester carboxylesterase